MRHNERMKDKEGNEIVIKLSAEEKAIVLDVLAVEQQDLELDRNKNEDAHAYGEILEGLRHKLQAA